MSFIYNISILFYSLGIRIAAFFNHKARQWIEGRKTQFKKMKKTLQKHDKVIWFHCASLGEFEQGRPLMEAMRKTYPNYKILLTFFSPSGYELHKNFKDADFVFYLPSDTPSHAKLFIEIFNPRLAVFVKYEFWFNYINELYKNKIPLLIVSAIFRPQQHFFHFWGYWFRRRLQKVTFFYVQNHRSSELLNKIHIYHNEISGDTRFDRVCKISEEQNDIQGIQHFKNNNLLMVAGSTWPPDEDILLKVMQNQSFGVKLIIAPHVVGEGHISELLQKFQDFRPVLYSRKEKIETNNIVLIINSIGLLSKLYRYADLAYIGGGFGAGIHNLLEAAVFGIPVLFGPNHKRFSEALDLIESGGGFSFSQPRKAVETCQLLLSDKTKRKLAGKAAAKYVAENKGATQIILNKIKEYLVVE